MRIWETAELSAARGERGALYHEFLRVPAMSAGLYEIPAGGTDLQSPHTEDEIYVVMAGRARFRCGDETRDVRRGSVIYVERGAEHRFVDVEEDLSVVVLFAPAERPAGADGDVYTGENQLF